MNVLREVQDVPITSDPFQHESTGDLLMDIYNVNATESISDGNLISECLIQWVVFYINDSNVLLKFEKVILESMKQYPIHGNWRMFEICGNALTTLYRDKTKVGLTNANRKTFINDMFVQLSDSTIIEGRRHWLCLVLANMQVFEDKIVSSDCFSLDILQKCFDNLWSDRESIFADLGNEELQLSRERVADLQPVVIVQLVIVRSLITLKATTLIHWKAVQSIATASQCFVQVLAENANTSAFPDLYRSCLLLSDSLTLELSRGIITSVDRTIKSADALLILFPIYKENATMVEIISSSLITLINSLVKHADLRDQSNLIITCLKRSERMLVTMLNSEEDLNLVKTILRLMSSFECVVRRHQSNGSTEAEVHEPLKSQFVKNLLEANPHDKEILSVISRLLHSYAIFDKGADDLFSLLGLWLRTDESCTESLLLILDMMLSLCANQKSNRMHISPTSRIIEVLCAILFKHDTDISIY
jgi:hypothetical protein